MNQWLFVSLNLFACSLNIGMSIRWFLRGRRLDREFNTVQQHFRTSIEEFLPAVAFCATVADNPLIDDEWRAAARAVIPKSVTVKIQEKITEGPLIGSDSQRVH